MDTTQAQIFQLFQALPDSDRRQLLARLSESLEDELSMDDLSLEEIAAIDEGLAQAERGETIDSDELFDRLAKKFGFSRI